MEDKGCSAPSPTFPCWAEAQDMKEHREEADSKRIHEQHMEPGIEDHVIHDFLSAGGEPTGGALCLL